MSTKNLWGDLPLAEAEEKSPAQVLDEQAKQLGPLTKNVLSGEVFKRPRNDGLFEATLYIVAEFLDEYRYAVCRIDYSPISLYPLELYDLVGSQRENVRCKTEEELLDTLSYVLQSEKVRKVISSLIRESGFKGTA